MSKLSRRLFSVTLILAPALAAGCNKVGDQPMPPLGADGLDIRRYQPARLDAMLKEVKETKDLDDPQAQRRLVDLDVELTYTYLSLASHLATGRLQPEKLRVEWYTKPRNVDLDARLGQALEAENSGEIVKILRDLP